MTKYGPGDDQTLTYTLASSDPRYLQDCDDNDVECDGCGTFIASEDAVWKDGEHAYCRECAKFRKID